jgi:hypothetical protein
MKQNGVAIRYFFPKLGKLINFIFPDMPSEWGITKCHLVCLRTYGDIITSPTSHPDRMGCVIMSGVDAKNAIEKAEWFIHNTVIQVDNTITCVDNKCD